jgi:NADPH-dependent curcumin reductase CurA
MHPLRNRQFRLAQRPTGALVPETWAYVENPMPEPGEEQFLAQVLYISLDPAMRGWLNDAKSYVPPVQLGEVMRAIAVGKVLDSKHPKFVAGDLVVGLFGVQAYALSDGKGVTKVEAGLVPLPTYLSTLGMPGLTAYFGLLDVGKPREGDTVVVSAAAGAVGAVVGQIAKIKGCRVVGLAGGPEKCRYVVDELGFDACIDYKHDDVKKKLRETCPKGVDVYFDNVGGEILDFVLTQITRGARIVICGAISQYNTPNPVGPKNYLSLLVNRASMAGMIVFDYTPRYGEALMQMGAWMAEGKLKSKGDVVKGLETFPDTINKLFKGENFGKLVIEV